MARVLLVVLVLLISLTPVISKMPIPAVCADSSGPYATIFPSSGTVYTNISIEVRNLTDKVRYNLYLYWDNMMQMQGLDNPSYWPMGSFQPTYLPYYDIQMNAPNEHPLSNLGDHTMLIQIWTFDHTQLALNSTLTFEIIEQLPCNEWLALNATYCSLLDNDTALNASYATLQAQYANLTSNYESLLTDRNNVLAQYSNLLTSYDSLSSNYNAISESFDSLQGRYNTISDSFNSLQGNYSSLSSDYNGLRESYVGLTGLYNTLQSVYNSLAANYVQLQGNYTQLTSSYNELQKDNNGLATDLTNYRNLSYALVVSTLIFLTTTIYLARRKPEWTARAK